MTKDQARENLIETLRQEVQRLLQAAQWWREQSNFVDLTHPDNQQALDRLNWHAHGRYLGDHWLIQHIFYDCVCTWKGCPIGYRRCGGDDKRVCYFYDLLKALGIEGLCRELGERIKTKCFVK